MDTVPISVDLKPGQVLSGTCTIHATVGRVKGFVEQVDLYVNGDMTATAISNPYTFNLNTLDLDDGDANFDFQVTTTLGDKGDAVVAVKIDNGVSKGIGFNVNRAETLLANGQYRMAEIAGRIAMKAALRKQDNDPSFDEKRDMNPVRIVLARANEGLSLFDRAQKFVEDALAADPDNVKIQDLAATINIKAALIDFRQSASHYEALEQSTQAMSDAISERAKLAQAKLDSFGAPTSANVMDYSDLAFDAGRYSLAASALETAVHSNPTQTNLINRLAYAQLKAQRYDAARETIETLPRFAQMDGYSYAILALLDTMTGTPASVTDDLKNAALNGAETQAVQTAEAFVALKENKLGAMGQILNTIKGQYPDCTETSDLTFIYMTAIGHGDEAYNAYQDAVLRNPVSPDAYLLQARLALAQSQKSQGSEQQFQYGLAAAYYRLAIAAMPESAEALTGLALIDWQIGKHDEAFGYVKAATGASKSYAASHYAAEVIYRLTAQTKAQVVGTDGERIYDARETMAPVLEAGKETANLDPINLGGSRGSSIAAVITYLLKNGSTPTINPPSRAE
jgi:tetratricopeptide (TPR) repeat protein